MKITFLGVGEACDPERFNTSLLLEYANGRQALLDCGFTVPHRYFAVEDDPERLHIVWISHFHGDHFFGLPLLLLRLWDMGRQGRLLVMGPKGIQEKSLAVLDLAYPNFQPRLNYSLEFIELTAGVPVEQAGLCWQGEPTLHSQGNLSIRVEGSGASLFYSGDGRPTAETLALAQGCDLIVHESFRLDDDRIDGHGTVTNVIDFAQKAKAGALALVHIDWRERQDKEMELAALAGEKQELTLFFPEVGEMVKLAE